MIVDVFGIEAFLPGSQIDVKPIRDYDVYVNKTMEFKVVKINHEFKNVVVSHKALSKLISKSEKRNHFN
jgi:small subunit ribosomal protein S1